MEHRGVVQALGLLPIRTTMQPQKVTTLTTGRLASARLFGQPMPETTIAGYEIHIGETDYLDGAQTFATLSRRTIHGDMRIDDGCIAHETRIFGTYLHGLFDDDTFRHAFLAAARAHHALSPASRYESWKQSREDSLNRLADAVAGALDLPYLFALAGQTEHMTEMVTNTEPAA
jgi:adenosylcobyric acid synthase